MFFFPVSLRSPPGQGHTVGLPLVALTVAQDHGPDQGLTLTLPAGPALVLAPTIDLILARPILDAMGVAMDALGPGPDPVRGLMDTGAPPHHALPSPTGEVDGREGKQRDLTGQGQDLAHLEASGAAPQMGENHLRVN